MTPGVFRVFSMLIQQIMSLIVNHQTDRKDLKDALYCTVHLRSVESSQPCIHPYSSCPQILFTTDSASSLQHVLVEWLG